MREDGCAIIILVVEDVEETRDGIEKLLETDGYLIDPARDEEDAVVKARVRSPGLVLVSVGGTANHNIATARRIRERAHLSVEVPVVVFCIENLTEGTELEVGENVHITRPENFDQLRRLLRRLVGRLPSAF